MTPFQTFLCIYVGVYSVAMLLIAIIYRPRGGCRKAPQPKNPSKRPPTPGSDTHGLHRKASEKT